MVEAAVAAGVAAVADLASVARQLKAGTLGARNSGQRPSKFGQLLSDMREIRESGGRIPTPPMPGKPLQPPLGGGAVSPDDPSSSTEPA
eukprot:gene34780-23272_t